MIDTLLPHRGRQWASPPVVCCEPLSDQGLGHWCVCVWGGGGGGGGRRHE